MYDNVNTIKAVNVPQALRILQGENPAAIPVGTVTEYMLMINTKTAREIGVVVPENILKSAVLVAE